MKIKNLLILISIFIGLRAAALTPVQFNFANAAGFPINAQFTLMPPTNVFGFGTNLVIARVLNITATNGTVTTNLFPYTYTLSIVGVSGYWSLSVPDTNVVVNALSLITNLPVPAPAFFPGVIQLLPGPGINVTPLNGSGIVIPSLAELSTDPFPIPQPMLKALTAKYQNNQTAYWDVNGSDGSAVLGDSTHPSLTFTNCIRLLGTNGGSIWATPGQNFPLFSGNYSVTNNLTLIGNGSQFGLSNITSTPHLYCYGNFKLIGGQWDWVIHPSAPKLFSLAYCTLYPDWLTVGNVDGVYFHGNQVSNSLVSFSRIKIFSQYDCVNNDGYLGTNSVTSADRSWFVALQPAPGSASNPCRAFVAVGTNISIFSDCLFVAVGSQAGLGSPPSSFTNACVSALTGARIFLERNIYIAGTPNLDTGFSIYAFGGSSVFFRDAAIPENIYKDGTSSVFYPGSTANSFIFVPQ